MSKDLLEQNWTSIVRNVVLPLWKKHFKAEYERIKLDYDDFVSLAGLELTKAMPKFDPKKSSLFTYATRVIKAKALTELRNCTQRDKRKALYMADTIGRTDGADSPKTICDSIAYVDNNKEISEISELRVGNFIKSLSNDQLRVLVLALLDFESSDMAETLNISDRTATNIIRSLKDTDLTRILYRRKF